MLPPDHARKLLKEAAQTQITKADPMAREKAIDRAINRIRVQYPHLYRQ